MSDTPCKLILRRCPESKAAESDRRRCVSQTHAQILRLHLWLEVKKNPEAHHAETQHDHCGICVIYSLCPNTLIKVLLWRNWVYFNRNVKHARCYFSVKIQKGSHRSRAEHSHFMERRLCVWFQLHSSFLCGVYMFLLCPCGFSPSPVSHSKNMHVSLSWRLKILLGVCQYLNSQVIYRYTN